jgi:hypothetical protein
VRVASEVSISEPMAVDLPKLRKLFKLYYGVLMQVYRPAYQKERLARRRWTARSGIAEN